MTTITFARRLALCGVAATFAFGAAACSSDDADEPATTNGGADTDAGDTDSDGGNDGDDGATGSFDDLDDDTVTGAYIAGFEAAFPDAEVEGIGERTIQVTFDEGTVETEGVMSCIIANGAAGDAVDVVVVYPDGETACD
ncbi:MAG: hypothetical protein JJU45_14290 [Acidimicrobiia bacterium]|nr:hypothetical protein [Acidimicrobiia bacterium]